jgi:acid stress-induced BolA-like protein IbaG/YrbA
VKPLPADAATYTHSLLPGVRMVTPEQVKQYIEQGMPCEHVEVNGDGHHFDAVIVSDEFRGRSRVQQHQRVYQALGDRMKAEIHALSMQTLTPEQWRSRS